MIIPLSFPKLAIRAFSPLFFSFAKSLSYFGDISFAFIDFLCMFVFLNFSFLTSIFLSLLVSPSYFIWY